MDLSNPSLWQLVYLQNFSGDFFGVDQLPIADFDTPSLTSQIIRLKITSSDSKPNWTRAGNCRQIIDAGNVQSVIKNYSLFLREDRVITLEPFAAYFLRFSLPRYFKQATVSIFGYTGS